MPTEQQAAALGVPLSAYAAQPPVVVWPENRAGVQLFMAMHNEWRQGMAGETGLDKSNVAQFQRMLRLKPRERDRSFRDLLALEDAALGVIHAKD